MLSSLGVILLPSLMIFLPMAASLIPDDKLSSKKLKKKR